MGPDECFLRAREHYLWKRRTSDAAFALVPDHCRCRRRLLGGGPGIAAVVAAVVVVVVAAAAAAAGARATRRRKKRRKQLRKRRSQLAKRRRAWEMMIQRIPILPRFQPTHPS
jgi:hypothetical protein